MNEGHLQFLSSPEWAQMLETDLLPWVLGVGDLGDDVLEVGPGPGLTTDLLRQRVTKVTAIEVDAGLAHELADRLAGTNVQIIHADATGAGLPGGRFSTATCFSVLHHMPSSHDQDALFAELHRVLRPAGLLLGVDSLDLEPIRQGHVGDTFNPVDPGTLPGRLASFGFSDIRVERMDYQFRFSALKPRSVHSS
jgi:SAM-dependent methyltransferase